MGVAQHSTNGVAALILRARERGGWVTGDEIDGITEGATPEELEQVYATLNTAGIRILDEDEIEASQDKPDEGGPTNDPVRLYLRSIGRVPLLTQKEEIALARALEAGLLAEQALRVATELSAEQVADLLTLADLRADDDEDAREALARVEAAGFAARRKLIESNLRLVVSIAKRYMGRGMLFLDLIQEGNLGLIRAVAKFDYTKGFKFSTYATWWIRQAVTRAIADQARTIRIPVHLVDQINKILRTQRNLAQTLNREPRVEDVAEALDLDPERVLEILRMSQEPISLETPVGEEDASNIGEFLEDPDAVVPLDAASYLLMQEQLETLMETLAERERRVIEMRYGIADGHVRTLEEVGKEFGVTRERIRQIESKTLSKLRHPSRADQLRDYLD